MTTTTMEKKTGAENIRWDLSDLFASKDDPKIEDAMALAKSDVKKFVSAYKGKVSGLTALALREAYEQLETLIAGFYKVSQYVHLVHATQTSDDAIKALVSRVDEVESHVSNDLLFFDLELAKVDADTMRVWLQDKSLAPYHYALTMTQKNAKYKLSEKEEQVINLKDLAGAQGLKKLYQELTASFEFDFELDGEVKTMNGSELRALRQHSDPDVRRRAMKMLFDRYQDNSLVITHIFNNLLKDYNTEKNMRGYRSAISIRNTSQDLDENAVNALHDATTASVSLVQRYYKLKKRLLNLPDMTLADIYAPLPTSNTFYTWDQAKELVLSGFKAFDDEFYDMAKNMFDENRVDGPVQKGKRGGAFCSSSTPDLKPYVLLNFLGRSRDVATMAHELGHAIHDRFAEKQTLFSYHPILPLAETASVFSEMIITDMLLKQESDPKAKQAILTDKLEDIFATSHRQNMFSRFEMQSHERISQGLMSKQDLCGLYKEELSLMFGDAVTISDEYQWEWSTIPHIFETPFYVYAYNFGNLLVIALYQQYLEEGEAFIPKFKDLLAAGSSESPVAITQKVGVDIRDPEFWKKGFVWIEGLIDQLEHLVNETA